MNLEKAVSFEALKSAIQRLFSSNWFHHEWLIQGTPWDIFVPKPFPEQPLPATKSTAMMEC